MTRLLQLLNSGHLKSGDELAFDYKGYRFCSSVREGGSVGDCSVITDNCNTDILSDRTFKTLTAWADACIQEHLHEYGTRYSAWKRVKHLSTGRNMDAIYSTAHTSEASKDTLIECLQQKLVDAQEELQKRKEESEGVKGQKEDATKHHSSKRIVSTSMDTPYGAYLVLQRMGKVAPESIENLKRHGLLEFRKMIHEFSVNDNGQLYEPVDQKESETWYDQQRRPSDRAVANYVYDFFKK